MKTERRHELQTNELAIWLNKWIEKIKPYSNGILGGLVVAVVAFFAVYLVNNRQEQSRALAWTAYFNAYELGDAEAFRKVGEDYAGTGAAMWALQSAGDSSLAAGAGQIFRDRDAAVEDLETARDAYRKVVDQVGDSDLSGEAKGMLRQRALFGLGQALESLGEFSEAEKRYQQVLDEFPPDAVAVGLAQQRLDALKQQSTRDWYVWLAEQKPAASPIATQGLFNNLPDLPDNPDLNLPNPGELLTPDTDPTTSSGDLLLEPSDPAGGDDLPLFGPENSTDDATPKLFELPADSTDTPTEDTTIDATADDGGTEDPAVDESAPSDGAPSEGAPEPTTDDADEATGDEATDDDSTSDESAADADDS